jgi:hypothetical protein
MPMVGTRASAGTVGGGLGLSDGCIATAIDVMYDHYHERCVPDGSAHLFFYFVTRRTESHPRADCFAPTTQES